MSEQSLRALTLGTAFGSGLVGGIFFAFSTFVMRALARIPPAAGIAAMQEINVAAINVAFMAALFGTGVGCTLLIAVSLLDGHSPKSTPLIAAGFIYLVGVVLVTIAANVPRNNALAAVNPTSVEGARLWADYVVTWTAWNHVRTATALVAAALLMLAL